MCAAYLDAKGDMGKIIETVYCASHDDEGRFRELLTAKIDSGELKSFKKFSGDTAAAQAKRRKAAEKEAREAEEMLRSLRQSEEYAAHFLAL